MIGFGNLVRSYVLQPHTLVKDLRTGVETEDAAAVLDGALDPFLAEQVRQRVFSRACYSRNPPPGSPLAECATPD